MNKILAFLWLILIGSNAAHPIQHYSQYLTTQNAIVLAGSIYFLFIYNQKLIRLFFLKNYIFIFSAFLFPIILMLFSSRSFGQGTYTHQISVVLVILVSALLAMQTNLSQILGPAAFTIVAIGSSLNIYELFIENNVWSLSPGRSAGLYLNPNISGQSLIGYGLLFLLTRTGKMTIIDILLMILTSIGVFASFSRASILILLLLYTAVIIFRMGVKNRFNMVFSYTIVAVLAISFVTYVVNNIVLSEDAIVRIDSLSKQGGIGDFREARGSVAEAGIELVLENPIFGAGVNTSIEMTQGPHNIYVALALDYGIVGLVVYLSIIFHLIRMAMGAPKDVSGIIWFVVAWFICVGFSSHNLLDDIATIPLFGIALGRAYQIQVSRKMGFSNR